MKLAIVGSRALKDKLLFTEGIQKAIQKWGRPVCVVSGGAKGADQMGERWAHQEKIPVHVFKPQWRVNGVYDKAAGIKRNADIIAAATHLLAFPSKTGRGTQNSIQRAKKKGIPIIVIYID